MSTSRRMVGILGVTARRGHPAPQINASWVTKAEVDKATKP